MSAGELAHRLLERLLEQGDEHIAGARARPPSLTARELAPYLKLRSWQQKQECDETFLAARDAGSVSITREKHNPIEGPIQRVDLLDLGALAKFLGRETYADRLLCAVKQLEQLFADFPVMLEVRNRWAGKAKVRGMGPEGAASWVDAARVLTASKERANDDVDTPVREFSARLFQDSKRIEALTPQLDILLTGNLDGCRGVNEVWQELGLFREEHPVLLAGNVAIERDRGTFLIDSPYVGLPAATIRSVASDVFELVTIENKTTFHSEAKRRYQESVLLVYTAGMPSPAWRLMYGRLLSSLPKATLVKHWGDIDEGGFRIAATLSKEARTAGFVLQPHRMQPLDVPLDGRIVASQQTLSRIRHFASSAGWDELGDLIQESGFIAEQESLPHA